MKTSSAATGRPPSRNALILPPSLRAGVHTENTSKAPLGTQRSWCTTEDMVKASSHTLTATTVARLAAFRYNGLRGNISAVQDDGPPTLQPSAGSSLHKSKSLNANYIKDGTRTVNSIDFIRKSFPQENPDSEDATSQSQAAQELSGFLKEDKTAENELFKQYTYTLPNAKPGDYLDSKNSGQFSSQDDYFSEGIADDDFDFEDIGIVNSPCLEVVSRPTSGKLLQDQSRLKDKFPSLFGDNEWLPPFLSNEDFPMSELEEEEMARLDSSNIVHETFKPPNNYTFESDIGSMEGDIHDNDLQYSSPSPIDLRRNNFESKTALATMRLTPPSGSLVSPVSVDEDQTFISQEARRKTPMASKTVNRSSSNTSQNQLQTPSLASHYELEDPDYLPLKPFARPEFPPKVPERSPVLGISSNLLLQTCFRVGEALRSGARCYESHQDAILELFARVTLSSRESRTGKQHFQFADLFHDRAPFLKGILDNYNISELQEVESRVFLSSKDTGIQVRCLGRLRREIQDTGWVLHILNIRATDWEEIRHTKLIAEAGLLRTCDF